jgi:hypothetical protein
MIVQAAWGAGKHYVADVIADIRRPNAVGAVDHKIISQNRRWVRAHWVLEG